MKIKNRIKKYPRLTKSFGQVRNLCQARRRRMFGDSGAGFVASGAVIRCRYSVPGCNPKSQAPSFLPDKSY